MASGTFGSDTFLTLLTPSNNSGVLGLARLSLEDTSLSVDVVASGLTPNEVHPFHLHGFVDGRFERPPAIDDDLDRDGFVETAEAEALAIGPVIAGLTASGRAQAFLEVSNDFPRADANGVVTFSQTYELDPENPNDAFIIGQLSTRAEGRFLEFHGLNVPSGAGAALPPTTTGGESVSTAAIGLGDPNAEVTVTGAGSGATAVAGEVNGQGGYNPQVPVAAGSLIGLDGTAEQSLAALSPEQFQSLASDTLDLLMPYMLRPDGTGPAAPESPDVLAAGEAADTFAALLAPSNNSGVLGAAVVQFDEDLGTVTVDVLASGLTPGEIHPQHIHGFENDQRSLLPNITLDSDADGFVEDPEGEPVIGPVLLAATASGEVTNAVLSPDFPQADANGDLVFSQTYAFNLDEADDAFIFQELQDRVAGRAFQIHGLELPPGQGDGTPFEVNGTGGYVDALPVANGILLPLSPDLPETELLAFGPSALDLFA